MFKLSSEFPIEEASAYFSQLKEAAKKPLTEPAELTLKDFQQARGGLASRTVPYVQNAVSSAGLGAVTGAITGGRTKHVVGGAAVGATIGLGVGALLNHVLDQNLEDSTKGRGRSTSPPVGLAAFQGAASAGVFGASIADMFGAKKPAQVAAALASALVGGVSNYANASRVQSQAHINKRVKREMAWGKQQEKESSMKSDAAKTFKDVAGVVKAKGIAAGKRGVELLKGGRTTMPDHAKTIAKKIRMAENAERLARSATGPEAAAAAAGAKRLRDAAKKLKEQKPIHLPGEKAKAFGARLGAGAVGAAALGGAGVGVHRAAKSNNAKSEQAYEKYKADRQKRMSKAATGMPLSGGGGMGPAGMGAAPSGTAAGKIPTPMPQTPIGGAAAGSHPKIAATFDPDSPEMLDMSLRFNTAMKAHITEKQQRGRDIGSWVGLGLGATAAAGHTLSKGNTSWNKLLFNTGIGAVGGQIAGGHVGKFLNTTSTERIRLKEIDEKNKNIKRLMVEHGAAGPTKLGFLIGGIAGGIAGHSKAAPGREREGAVKGALGGAAGNLAGSLIGDRIGSALGGGGLKGRLIGGAAGSLIGGVGGYRMATKNIGRSHPGGAQGQPIPAQKVAAAEKSDAEQAEVGRSRAVANLASGFTSDAGSRRERFGDLLGRAGGAAAGGGAGFAASKGSPFGARLAATLGGAALGDHLGGRAGKAIGNELDQKAFWKQHAVPDHEIKEGSTGIENAIQAALPIIAGVSAGFSPGRNIAGETAAALAPKGRVIRSENVARQAGFVGVPAGALADMAGAHKGDLAGKGADLLAKHFPGGLITDPATERAALRIATPAVAAMLGSLVGGGVTGGSVGLVQKLRGPLHPQKKEASNLHKIAAILKRALSEEDVKDPNAYLQQEQAALEAEGQQEAGYLRQQLQEAQEQLSQLQEQSETTMQEAEQTKQQLEQMQQQQASILAQADAATMQAHQVAASSMGQVVSRSKELMNQTELAANMRNEHMALKERLMQEAVAEPAPASLGEMQAKQDAEAQAAMAAAPVDPATGQPMVDPAAGGDPAAAGAPPVGEGEAAAAGGEGEPPKAEKKPESESKPKEAMHPMLAGGLIGAGVGGAAAFAETKLPNFAEGAVKRLEGKEGGFAQAIALARARAMSEESEIAKQYPGKATAMGAARGALIGAGAGHSLGEIAAALKAGVR